MRSAEVSVAAYTEMRSEKVRGISIQPSPSDGAAVPLPSCAAPIKVSPRPRVAVAIPAARNRRVSAVAVAAKETFSIALENGQRFVRSVADGEAGQPF